MCASCAPSATAVLAVLAVRSTDVLGMYWYWYTGTDRQFFLIYYSAVSAHALSRALRSNRLKSQLGSSHFYWEDGNVCVAVAVGRRPKKPTQALNWPRIGVQRAQPVSIWLGRTVATART
eukprot:scaffold33958_cov136-Isochrysis_galbana.AAC.4